MKTQSRKVDSQSVQACSVACDRGDLKHNGRFTPMRLKQKLTAATGRRRPSKATTVLARCRLDRRLSLAGLLSGLEFAGWSLSRQPSRQLASNRPVNSETPFV